MSYFKKQDLEKIIKPRFILADIRYYMVKTLDMVEKIIQFDALLF